MKKYLISLSILFGILFFGFVEPTPVFGFSAENSVELHAQADNDLTQLEGSSVEVHAEEGEHDSHSAPTWLVIPFITLLLMIATGPLFYEHFWHHNYPKIAVGFALIVVLYYLFVLENVHSPVHALAEYIQFIALLASLYVASGGILIEIDKKSNPHGECIAAFDRGRCIQSYWHYRSFHAFDPAIYSIEQRKYSSLSHRVFHPDGE
jgi:hypothetical protein